MSLMPLGIFGLRVRGGTVSSPRISRSISPGCGVWYGSEPVNIWTMSQRAGSVSYLTFAAGLALGLYGLFVVACDVWPLALGIFRTLGTNALAGYVLHILVMQAMKPFVPGDSPLWYVATALAVFLTICYTLVRHLEKHRLYLKL